MAIFNVEGIGKVGVLKDPSPVSLISLPPNAMTDARNVLFRLGSIHKVLKRGLFLDLPIEPYFVMDASNPVESLFVAAGLAKVYGFTGSASADITRVSGDYSGGAKNFWTGGVFNGIPFLNNGVDLPQSWNPPSLSQPLVDMPAFPSTVRVKALRQFKNFIVGLDVTDGSTRFPRRVKWSHSAQSGLPTSWDSTDPTLDAGETDLPEGVDRLLDCLVLGDTNVIYCEDSIWAMRFVGPPFIFSFNSVFTQLGAIGVGCATVFERGHAVFARDDIVIHDLASVRSIADNRIRDWVFKNMNQDHSDTCRVVSRSAHSEVWFMFPYQTSSLPNIAAVWRWPDDTWSIVDIPQTQSATRVSVAYAPDEAWDADAGTWDADATLWDTGTTSRNVGEILIGSLTDTSVHLISDEPNGLEFYLNGQSVGYNAYFERDYWCHIPNGDRRTVKLLLSLTIHGDIDPSLAFTVFIGTRMLQSDPINFSPPLTYFMNQDFLEFTVSARFFTIHVASQATTAWRIDGIDIEVIPVGLV